ncbi:MAG TPA: NHL repeat-containing protein [Candidatus Tumulicola sp.]
MKSLRHYICAAYGGAALVLLTACASQGINYATPTTNASALSRPSAQSDCPLHHCIIVADGTEKRSRSGSILFFARDASGNAAPVGAIEGSSTQLDYPTGLAMSADGTLYAANLIGPTVTVYPKGATGDVAPIRTIAGTKTKLAEPTGVALDAAGKLFVSNSGNNSITVYPKGANGNVSPVRTISGDKTMLSYPWGIALDSKSNIYVSDGSSITVYPPDAVGNAAPKRRISGNLSQLVEAEGITVDAAGYIYVVDWDAYELDVFAPNSNGNVAPGRQDSGGLYGPDGVALDASGKTYVSNGCQDDPAFIFVYAAGANNVAPLRAIRGQKPPLYCFTNLIVR